MNSTERCGRSLLSNAAVKRPARSPVINCMASDLHEHCAPGGIRTPNLLIRRGSYVRCYGLNQQLWLHPRPRQSPATTSPAAFRVTNRSTFSTCEAVKAVKYDREW